MSLERDYCYQWAFQVFGVEDSETNVTGSIGNRNESQQNPYRTDGADEIGFMEPRCGNPSPDGIKNVRMPVGFILSIHLRYTIMRIEKGIVYPISTFFNFCRQNNYCSYHLLQKWSIYTLKDVMDGPLLN